jgi:hypothetical protein
MEKNLINKLTYTNNENHEEFPDPGQSHTGISEEFISIKTKILSIMKMLMNIQIDLKIRTFYKRCKESIELRKFSSFSCGPSDSITRSPTLLSAFNNEGSSIGKDDYDFLNDIHKNFNAS